MPNHLVHVITDTSYAEIFSAKAKDLGITDHWESATHQGKFCYALLTPKQQLKTLKAHIDAITTHAPGTQVFIMRQTAHTRSKLAWAGAVFIFVALGIGVYWYQNAKERRPSPALMSPGANMPFG